MKYNLKKGVKKMKAVSVLIGLFVFGIGFIIGGSAFHVRLCESATDAIVAGRLKAPTIDNLAPVRLDNEPEATLFVYSDGSIVLGQIQPALPIQEVR